LTVARQAEVELARQKQVNLTLQETISQLQYDINEMRIQSSRGHTRTSTNTSLPGTVSKTLGAQLAKSLKGENGDSSIGGKSEDNVRTVYKTVTIHTERVSVEVAGRTRTGER
jgi:hypothetical protein